MRRHTVRPARKATTATRPGTERAAKATRKGRETDEAFRAAARTVFARDGYLNSRISDIAAEAGKSVASFYNYYDTKADLLAALAEDFHHEASELTKRPYRAGLAPQEALREAVAAFWHTYRRHRGELVGVFQASMLEEEFRERWLAIRAEGTGMIAAEIRRAQKDGYCPGADPELTASALSAMLEHSCYIWMGHGDSGPSTGTGTAADTAADEERAIDALATIWVKSVYWRP
ncbi:MULTISPECIES: TetR/AcrR family transcriptional regulator [unclassified Streptomyces]|uniref:TetR/AcrR family transcriptional regulator n=1 Tax=unclassified Streptomyces TaxID=2593676 RepID=UPI002E17B415|nr:MULTISPECIES: TetR/AcrR family transcriptional regulator [unclassified Streptomyces]